MPRKQHIVCLPRDDRRTLTRLVRTGRQSAWTAQRARILLLAETAADGPAWSDAAVADAVGVAGRTAARARAAWCAQGLACLTRKPQARDRPDAGNRRAGLHRSAARVRPLVAAAADGPDHRAGDRRHGLPRDGAPGAPKRGVQPWRTARFLIPPGRDASYVAAMEVVLDTYQEPIDPAVPLVCFDAAGKALQAHRHDPLPPRPGPPAREDPEYARAGSANLFLSYAPHRGWRQVTVTAQRTAVDWAHAMRDLVDGPVREAPKLIVVLDNLNTHRLSSRYTTFPAPEAHRIARRLDLRFTPRHGSWRNMAELELSVLGRLGRDRRIAEPAQWTVTVDEARTRLTHLYPLPVGDTSTLTDH